MTRWRDVPPLTIDPGRQFGKVCINGTRLPATTVAWSVWAERDAAGTADDYGTTREEVLLACWWFVHDGYLNTISGERKRKRQWTEWADHALRMFGGWEKRKRTLCDPDDYEIPVDSDV